MMYGENGRYLSRCSSFHDCSLTVALLLLSNELCNRGSKVVLRWQCIVNQFCSTILLHFLFVWTSFFILFYLKKNSYPIFMHPWAPDDNERNRSLLTYTCENVELKKYTTIDSSLGQPILVSISFFKCTVRMTPTGNNLSNRWKNL